MTQATVATYLIERLKQAGSGRRLAPGGARHMLDRFDTSEALKRLCAELSPDKGQRTAQVGQSKPRAKVFQGARNRA